MLVASGPFDGEEHAFEITLFGEPDEPLLDIGVYSRPPAIRAIMSGLRLNYCLAGLRVERRPLTFALQPCSSVCGV